MNRPNIDNYYLNDGSYMIDLEEYCDALETALDYACELLEQDSYMLHNDRGYTLFKKDHWKNRLLDLGNRTINDDSPSYERKPIDSSYSPCDFTTYAKCPRCGSLVRDGIGGGNKRCPSCDLLLNWE